MIGSRPTSSVGLAVGVTVAVVVVIVVVIVVIVILRRRRSRLSRFLIKSFHCLGLYIHEVVQFGRVRLSDNELVR